MEFIILKSIHIISVLILFACLCVEFFLLEPKLARQRIKTLSLIDGLYGISSLVILASGFYIALRSGKGNDFYFDNSSIYIKLFLFVCVGLLSIYPTVFFFKNRKGSISDEIAISDNVKRVIFIEILLVLCIPFFSVILANGVML